MPDGLAKPRYCLPEPDYSNYAISFGDGEYALILAETEDDDNRLRAKTPRDMLLRNVIYPARNLTVL